MEDVLISQDCRVLKKNACQLNSLIEFPKYNPNYFLLKSKTFWILQDVIFVIVQGCILKCLESENFIIGP